LIHFYKRCLKTKKVLKNITHNVGKNKFAK